MFLNLNNPQDAFKLQGRLNNPNYFEGWYYKHVHEDSQKSISFIFGFSTHQKNPHSFIQVIETDPLKTHYFSFPLESFQKEGDGYRIEEAFFSKEKLILNLEKEAFKCKVNLDYHQSIALKASLYAPSIMGPFAYLNGMECNHGIVSMKHQITGHIMMNGIDLHFKEDSGYIEKDWGRSFPKRYIWLQGNHFKDPNDYFMLSVAEIPFGILDFEGIIGEFNLAGKSYRIATYYGAKRTSLQSQDTTLSLRIQQARYRFEIDAEVKEKGSLVSPLMGEMKAIIKEGLGGTVCLKVYERNKIIFESCSKNCGIEVEGY